MPCVRLDPTEPEESRLASAAGVLAAGGVVAFPTDTLYGLAADPRNPEAVERLYRIKGRRVDQAVPLIAASLAQVTTCAGELSPMAAALAGGFWPGPLTLVLPAWSELAPAVHGGLGTAAIRVPAHLIARRLAAAFGYPVTSTSANQSGRGAPSVAEDLAEDIRSGVDLVLDGGPSPGGLPSTIVDARGDEPRLVRQGAVSWERVLEFLRYPAP